MMGRCPSNLPGVVMMLQVMGVRFLSGCVHWGWRIKCAFGEEI
jgi:hypothetical protein